MAYRCVSDGWGGARCHVRLWSRTSSLQRLSSHAEGLSIGTTVLAGGSIGNETRSLLCWRIPKRRRTDRHSIACNRRGSGILQAGSCGQRVHSFGGAIGRRGALASDGGRVDVRIRTHTSASGRKASSRRHGVWSGAGIVEWHRTPEERHCGVCRVHGRDAAHIKSARGQISNCYSQCGAVAAETVPGPLHRPASSADYATVSLTGRRHVRSKISHPSKINQA